VSIHAKTESTHPLFATLVVVAGRKQLAFNTMLVVQLLFLFVVFEHAHFTHWFCGQV
jgi:hypothetical protein